MPGRNHPDGPASETPGAAPKHEAFRPLQQTAFSSLEHAAFLERFFCSGLMKSGSSCRIVGNRLSYARRDA
jgi:hypothetical protein